MTCGLQGRDNRWPIDVDHAQLRLKYGKIFMAAREPTNVDEVNCKPLVKGLSVIEKDVVAELSSGRSLADITQLRIASLNTVCSQLKSICRKVGTHRQAELVDFVLEGNA